MRIPGIYMEAKSGYTWGYPRYMSWIFLCPWEARPRRWKLAHKVVNKYNIFLTLTELYSYVKYIIITIRMSTMVIDRKNGYKFGFWTNLVNGTVYRCNNRKCKATIVVNGIIFILRIEYPFSELLMLRSR